MPIPVECFTEFPLTLSLSPLGRGNARTAAFVGEGAAAYSLSPTASACGCGTLSCKLAKASLLGEGWGEGVLCRTIQPNPLSFFWRRLQCLAQALQFLRPGGQAKAQNAAVRERPGEYAFPGEMCEERPA